MANKTVSGAASIHGQNPQHLFDNMVRNRVYDSIYWKEKLFALTAQSLVDEAIKLKYIGGSYGGMRKASDFQCLIMKMLQIQPDKETIMAFIEQNDYKYATALGLFYFRLSQSAADIYNCLSAYYVDYRKLRLRQSDGRYKIIHMDEFVDLLLKEEILFDVILPRIPKRSQMEDEGKLIQRISPLEEQILKEMEKEEQEEAQGKIAANQDALYNEDNQQHQQEINNLKNGIQNDEVQNHIQQQQSKIPPESKQHHHRHSKDHKQQKKDKKHWRKIVKGGDQAKTKAQKSRSNSNNAIQIQHNKIQELNDQENEHVGGGFKEGSIEYWNHIRKKLGMSQLS